MNKETKFAYWFGALFGVIAISSTSLMHEMNRNEILSTLIISIVTIVIISVVYLLHKPNGEIK